MAKPVWRPVLSRGFLAAARSYGIDIAGSVFLFVAASLMAGRVWRFPFDDEIYTLGRLERHAVFAAADVHPPFSYLAFAWLDHAGASLPAMRLASLAMTALALALFHLVALTLMRRRREDIAPASRLTPAVVICAVALYTAIDRRRPAAPLHLLLLMLATAALTILPGFAKPRSFLYLAPVVTLFVVLWFDRELRQGRIGRAACGRCLANGGQRRGDRAYRPQ
jgi:hypothetical protein